MGTRSLLLVAALLIAGARPAVAQVFTPSFLSPQLGEDTGVYLNGGPGDFSIEGMVRRSLGGFDLGVRGGVGSGDRAMVLVGADFRAPFRIPDAPVLAAYTVGVQGIIGNGGGAGFQGGATIGYPFTEGVITAIPYIHPRLALVSPIGGNNDLDLDILADFGVDVVIQRNAVFRVGFGFGNPTARWGIGFAWR